jgi:hypothetical protein
MWKRNDNEIKKSKSKGRSTDAYRRRSSGMNVRMSMIEVKKAHNELFSQI